MKEPNFFIVGAPKCGTTSLAHWLSQHPNIFMCRPKEPNFFNTDMNNRRPRTFNQYLRLFEPVRKEHKAIGEASIWYLYSKTAISNIIRRWPSARIIICLRNPIEMAVSLHNQLVKTLDESLKDFAEAWEAQAERRNGYLVSKHCADSTVLQYKDICSLGRQVEEVLAAVPANQLFLIFLEDLRQSPEEVYSDICGFLGLPPFDSISFTQENTSSANKFEVLRRFLKALNLVHIRLGIPPLNTGITKLISSYNTRSYDRPAPDGIFIENKVLPALTADIDKLAEITGRDLSHYKAFRFGLTDT